MTVRDFVLMTIALEQQMQLASSRGSAPPVYSPYTTIDSGYPPVPPTTAAPVYPQPEPQPQPYPQYPPTGTYPSPAPTYPPPAPTYPPSAATYPPATTSPPAQSNPRRGDSVPGDTMSRPVPSETLPRRDSLPRRDTLPARRDTIVLPRSDTSSSPPDSVPSR